MNILGLISQLIGIKTLRLTDVICLELLILLVLKMCLYIYIYAVNPKQNVGIDRYRNIPF